MPTEVSVFMKSTSNRKGHMMMLSNAPLIWDPMTGRFQPTGFIEAAGFANMRGIQPNRMCLMRAASNVDAPGFRRIAQWHPTDSREHIAADAIHICEPGTMSMFQSADCASVAVYNRRTEESILYHCGRPAGMPVNGRNIITDVLDKIAPNNEVAELEVIICGSICGAHFCHQEGVARQQADAYLEEFGSSVFHDVESRSLDMKRVLKAVHVNAGLTLEQITFFGPDCTFAAPCCASNRKDMVTKQKRKFANSILWLH